ncbi:lipase [Pseudonocardiaceae bacterium YIM PH 21723]|nr:lipase [Pseudonocardiaceae bacterium YIM PH 21723]
MRRLASLVCLALLGFAAPAAAADDLPVPYNVAASSTVKHFFDSPPGANDWSCRPSAEHPNPVVLAHGLTANMAGNWSTVAPLLKNNGYCVYALTYGRNPLALGPLREVGGLVRMEDSAREFGLFVDRVLASTGAAKVDIVGHSEGSLMPNYWVKFLGGAPKVDHYVGLTPLWRGTDFFGVAGLSGFATSAGLSPVVDLLLNPLCASCRQFLTGSPFLEKMNSDGGPKVPGVNYTMIMTQYDELVQPYTRGIMDGATNVVLQDLCADDHGGHVTPAFDPVATRVILNSLDPAHQKPVPCVKVYPWGAPGYQD